MSVADDLGALDLVPEAVLVLDPEGRILHANARATGLLGVGSDAYGRVFDEVVALEDDAGNPCGIGLLRASPAVDRMAERMLRLRLPDGRVRPVAIAGRYVDGHTVLTVRNAGRREQLDRARSDLVATVSHEIRSPLTSVKGFTRTMLSRWDRFSDEQKRTMLETINEDADRVTRLLKELLDVSRIDAGRVQLHKQPVDVAAIARGVVDKAGHRPEGDGRTVVVEIADGPTRVSADPDKVEQVLTNLVENALKYAPDSDVAVRVHSTDGMVHVAVEDQGPGIPEDQVRRIFEKFGRGRGNRRAGTGLGLYISRGLVTAHGGRVWCDSVEGKGSTFHVELPLEPGDD